MTLKYKKLVWLSGGRTTLIATRFWVVMICPIIKCLNVLEFSFILFDLCLFITIFNFILNYVPIVTFWILTYHKIWILLHSVESPSMVDPQWDIWYWGSKWNLHTVCWSAVGCEWGTTSVYFGITYVCFVPSRLPVFAVEPQYLLKDFLLLSKVSFEGHIQNLQKISCWFKIWMRFVGPILI